MFERLSRIHAKLPAEVRDDLGLLCAARDDATIRRLAEGALPPGMRAKRPRGRPPKQPAPTDAPGDNTRDPLSPDEWTPGDMEVAEAVARYVQTRARIGSLRERLKPGRELDEQITALKNTIGL